MRAGVESPVRCGSARGWSQQASTCRWWGHVLATRNPRREAHLLPSGSLHRAIRIVTNNFQFLQSLMTDIYRFRTLDQLLTNYQELTKQEIYFATQDQLNDPVEGRHDIVWQGDEIVWLNLFKNYTYCIHSFLLLVNTGSSQTFLSKENIPVYGRWDIHPTPWWGEPFKRAWAEVQVSLNLTEICQKLADGQHQVRSTPLVSMLYTLHAKMIEKVHEVHVEFKLARKTELLYKLAPYGVPLLSQIENSSKKLRMGINCSGLSGQIVPHNHQILDKLILEHKHMHIDCQLSPLIKNWLLLLLDFPSLYVEQLSRLLWPQWYTACFAKSYHNSSVWAHYADNHKGICLIFEADEVAGQCGLSLKNTKGNRSEGGEILEDWGFNFMELHDVNYLDRPEKIDFFSALGRMSVSDMVKLWFTNEDGDTSECVPASIDEEARRRSYWDNPSGDVVLKSKDWEYESECRLIMSGRLEHPFYANCRNFMYRFSSLKGVIFGIRTSDYSKLKIIDVIHEKCQIEGKAEFGFFQAYFDSENGRIEKYEIPFADYSGGGSAE